ncbi:MAG: nucleotidyltransferase family protein [Candidatus Eiseniibacteriota bacterium]
MTGATLGRIAQGGIIAAGEGSRLKAGGWRMSKPMVPVAGRPLIDHALDRFRAAGIRRLTIIINEESADCRDWLAAHAGAFDLDLIVRTTPSSYVSFGLVAERLEGAPAVITTVDGVMATADFQAFLLAAAGFPADATVLGLTDLVDDEKPLWAELDPKDGRITRLGGTGGSHVTAGLYVLPGRRAAGSPTGFERLREYLGWLVDAGQKVYGVVLPRVFDIDRAADIAAAERAAGMSEARSKGV